MPDNPITYNLRDGVILIEDGGSNTLELTLDAGDLSLKWGGEDRLISDRGALDHFRPGDEKPVEVTFGAKVSKIVADDTSLGGTDTAPTPYNALKRTGPAAGWTSCGGANEPYLCQLVFRLVNPDATGRRQVVTLNYFRCESCEFKEGEETDELSFSGRARIAAPVFTYEEQS